MLWTVVVFVLLCAIGGALWLHYRQEQAWRREWAEMSDGGGLPESFSVDVPSVKTWWQQLAAWLPLRLSRKGDSSRKAHSRLLAVKQYTPADEAANIPDYIDDSSAFSKFPENAAETEVAAAQARKRITRLPAYPDIVPFVESSEPEYRARKVRHADWEEITLQEATSALGEAALLEAARSREPEFAMADTAPQTAKQPEKEWEIIGFDDPVLSRTRERVLAGVNGISRTNRAAKPQAAGVSANGAISADSIRADLHRQSATAARADAGQRTRPQLIGDDEILANLTRKLMPRRQARSANLIKNRQESNAQPQRQNIWAQEKAALKPAASVAQPRPAAQPEPTPSAIARVQPVAAAPIPQTEQAAAPRPKLSIQDLLVRESAPADEYHAAEADDAPVAAATLAAAEPVRHAEPVAEMPAPDAATFMPSENQSYAAPAPATWQPPVQAAPQTAQAPAAYRPQTQPAPAADGQMILPSVDLLLPPEYDPSARQTEEALLENSITIEDKLAEFKVKVKVMDAYAGPVITRYEIEPDVGVRGNSVLNLEKDLARSLGVASIRVVETIPGKTCMGLELPNPRRQMIRLSEIFNAPAFSESRSKLTLALGQDITGEPVVTDLAKAPHLLVAGTTGSGKSVGVNAMILSMLFKASPEEVRMIMIDPKMLELSIYEGIPHLLAPVVTDMKLAANALNWCVNEMEKRYRLMSHAGVRNLAGFNQKIAEAAARGEKIVNPFTLTPDNPEYLEKLPYIVVVVDEFADLMMTAGKKIEELIARLAQKARAAGIHLILATQRPSVDVITGLIKANIPTRIAFQVSSKVDSRTILDQMGAENLLGQGDMLFLPPGTGYPQRVHGAFASDEEVHNVVEYLKQFGEPDYIDEILSGSMEELPGISRSSESEADPLYDEAVAFVIKSRKASISGVQRALRIGYNRAARLIDQMESDGIVSAPETNGNRSVLARNSDHLDG
ncbi:putative cell-division protein [Bergeriella denitrificans]|uniref:Putative cell-division protein n=1 Tax=Bergeriella denitrificans TaxID=494 RepID=A0A378UI85_BERDE|nr:DNA translocase FtsK [Bergeriella denitrificans]STZ76211.1 putative cell-division protein [Bergeriella denitrificans]